MKRTRKKKNTSKCRKERNLHVYVHTKNSTKSKSKILTSFQFFPFFKITDTKPKLIFQFDSNYESKSKSDTISYKKRLWKKSIVEASNEENKGKKKHFHLYKRKKLTCLCPYQKQHKKQIKNSNIIPIFPIL